MTDTPTSRESLQALAQAVVEGSAIQVAPGMDAHIRMDIAQTAAYCTISRMAAPDLIEIMARAAFEEWTEVPWESLKPEARMRIREAHITGLRALLSTQ